MNIHLRAWPQVAAVAATAAAAAWGPLPPATASTMGHQRQHSDQSRWWCDEEPLDEAAAIGRVAWVLACNISYPPGEPFEIYKRYGYPVFQVSVPTDPYAACALVDLDLADLRVMARCEAVGP